MNTHPVIILATGAPTCGGIDLDIIREQSAIGSLSYEVLRMRATSWVRDGYLLCLRPTAYRPACVGLSPTQFADASLQADFAARALVVDPYDAEGNDIRERPGVVVSGHVQQAVDRLENDPPHTATWSAQRRAAAWERYGVQQYMGKST